jgi:NAD(P)-dependent dehydrogenase (short-subunit alcohol dehydrogenase family)
MTNRNSWWLMAAAGAGALAAARSFIRQQRAMSFAGQTVLITGGSRGLGLLLARRFTAAGAKVALCARDSGELDRARVDLLERGALEENVFTYSCDVTDTSQVAEAVEAVIRRFGGPVDILVNNAGIIQVGPMEVMTQADYEEALRVHFWAPYHFIHAVLPGMKAKGTGRIVNVSSVGGLVSFPHLLPYTTSKAALVGFSEGLRAELRKEKIWVTTVCPGLIRTGSPMNAYFRGQHEKEHAWFKLADSLPGASMSADKAADQIVDAVRHGDPFVVTSFAAQAGALVHGVFPGLTDDLLGVVDGLLPAPPEKGESERRTGKESDGGFIPSLLTALTDKAARDNNEERVGTAHYA